MATLIPAIGTCLPRMTSGERRLAERLEQKLDDDCIPLFKPISCGRDGQAPQIIRRPNPHPEATKVAELLNAAHHESHAWGDMAVICRRYDVMVACAHALNRARLPHQVRKGAGSFHPNEDTIKVLTIHASKGLEFPVMELVVVG